MTLTLFLTPRSKVVIVRSALLRLKWTWVQLNHHKVKDRLPQYVRKKLVDLQNKFDELEKLGVFKRPEGINVVVEYLNPSFLVKKSNCGYRLCWRERIQQASTVAHARHWFHPFPNRSVEAYHYYWFYECVLSNPTRTRVYEILRCSHSVPWGPGVCPFSDGQRGSETALEELMCRVLGDLIHEGVVAKIADDLYCVADSPEELFIFPGSPGWKTESRYVSDTCERANSISIGIRACGRGHLWIRKEKYLPRSWAGSGTLVPSRPPLIELQP